MAKDNKDAQSELERLRAENEALRKREAERSQIRFKVSEKGAVSAYGIHTRFPVTLYAEQWERLLDKRDDVLAFIRANESKLSRK